MIEIFKNWIAAMLCLGIFVTFIQLILPKTNLKKYIYSLIGIITIITVISPVINLLKNQDIEEGVSQVLANISSGTDTTIDYEKYKNAKEEAVKEGFIESVKKDIKSNLFYQNIQVENINIILDEEYNIIKIEVYIKKSSSHTTTIDVVNTVGKYIHETYDIDYSKITVVEEGE